MESTKHGTGPPNPLHSISSFIHQHFRRLGDELSVRLEETRRHALNISFQLPLPPLMLSSRGIACPLLSSSMVPFASLSQRDGRLGNKASGGALSSQQVAKALTGTSLYAVSNSNNEFVLISDQSGIKSISLLCFRQEDAEAFLAQVRLNKGGLRGGAKVVPISLDQVYMLKVEGIAFRFLPDPVQIKNALEMKSSGIKGGFDGIPVFQSDLLVVNKKNRRYCPIYFRKEDLERELSKVSRVPKGTSVSQSIVVGCFEDVLRRMEMSEKNSGWDDLIFVPPGKSCSQHIQELAKTP